MQYVFFSMRNFKRDGGGSIRMYGVLNALADRGHDVTFISNATTFVKFDSAYITSIWTIPSRI